MNESLLVKLLGFPATLIHGDSAVLDRWTWLKRRLPKTRNGENLIDVGCGTGAYSIGAALRGYESLGLSWDERNQRVANERARLCKATDAKFEILDVRQLDERKDLVEKFDVALCCENIEHILDDRKLMQDMAACLKPGGRLLLTTPQLFYRPITKGDMGPFLKVEEGWHVRRGYTQVMLEELCAHAGLLPAGFFYRHGFFSQKLCGLLWRLCSINFVFGWLLVLPLRILPPLFDGLVYKLTRYPYYCICMEAYKPRYGAIPQTAPSTAARSSLSSGQGLS
jgi:SAM-dependent methyltransferase